MDIIWERSVDMDAQQRRLRLFWILYGVPTALVLCGGCLVSGPGGACGLFILLGTLGSMIFGSIWLMNRTERTNTLIGLDGGELVWGQRRVRIDEVERFRVGRSQASMSMVGITGSHTNASADLGVATFFLADGTSVDFVFALLSEPEIDSLRVALEAALPGLQESD